MSKVLQNNKTTISLGRLSYFVYFVACSCTSMETTVLSCRFSWLWSGMPKVLWSNKSPVSLERVEWFCWLFASSYFLHLVRYPLKLRKYAIWAGIVRHSLSANQIVRCFKLKKFKKDMSYQVDSLLPLKLEEILLLWVMTQNSIGQSVCRIFYFWLVWLVKLNIEGPLIHCTCLLCI